MTKWFYPTMVPALLASLLLSTACTSEKRTEAALARIGDEAPPDFLSGPAAVAFLDCDGFSANVVESVASGLPPSNAAGELIGRQGRLIFQPWATALVKNAKFFHGGMFFIQDIANANGYVLSEALQACAPISPAVYVTNQTVGSTEPAGDSVNGHPCHRTELLLELNDGSSARLTVWRADDLRHFPVRLRLRTASDDSTVDFSNVRLDLPSPELFYPPRSFTMYASAQALINELMIRESTQRSGPSGPMAEPVETTDQPIGLPGPGHP